MSSSHRCNIPNDALFQLGDNSSIATTWKRHLEPDVILNNFIRHIYVGASVQTTEFHEGHEWSVLEIASSDNKTFSSPLEIRLDIDASSKGNVGSEIFISTHVKSQNGFDNLQPFSSLEDHLILLKPGFVYEIKAKVHSYRRWSGRKKRCSNDLTFSSWQV